mgnify:CR=1 FL=1
MSRPGSGWFSARPAAGAVCIRRAGRAVPDDLSVVGFDDIEFNTFPLTTVSIPTYDAGKAMAWTLFDRILQRRESGYKHIQFEQRLVVRASVKVLGANATAEK